MNQMKYNCEKCVFDKDACKSFREKLGIGDTCPLLLAFLDKIEEAVGTLEVAKVELGINLRKGENK